jgi:uncharacterized protein
MPAFSVRIHDIPEGRTREDEFVIDAAWLAAELAGTDVRLAKEQTPGRVRVRSQQTGGTEFLVTANVTAHVATDCVRCLGDATIPVNLELTAIYAPRPAGISDEELEARQDKAESVVLEDDNEGDLSREFYSGDELVLDTMIRENILLEVPMQPLCASDCRGIEIPAHLRPPADFGEKPAVDERLAPLKKLAEKLSKS